jgi:hypothetical protein
MYICGGRSMDARRSFYLNSDHDDHAELTAKADQFNAVAIPYVTPANDMVACWPTPILFTYRYSAGSHMRRQSWTAGLDSRTRWSANAPACWQLDFPAMQAVPVELQDLLLPMRRQINRRSHKHRLKGP